MPAKSAPPPPASSPQGSPKKPGFFSGLATAAREISSEVNRARNNQLPTGMASATAASPAQTTVASAPASAPLNLANFSLNPSSTAPTHAAEMTFALTPSPGAGAEEGLKPAPLPQATQPAGPQRLTNPWPSLRDTERSHALNADAYFHPYTSADVDYYSQGLTPVAGVKAPEVITLIAVEAGEQEMFSRLNQLFRTLPGIYGSIGFNPRNLQNDMDAMDERLTTLLNQTPNLIAVGPIGIDANYSPSSLPQQIDQLVRQLEIAADFDLPAIIFHNKAIAQLQQALNSTVLPKKLVWLKPIRQPQELDLIQQTDAYVVMRAELTHPKEDFYQRAISQLLPQRLLIGSGNSLNAVHNKAGQFNSPSSLPEILRIAAQLLGMAPKALQVRVNANFAHVYGPAEE